LIPLVKIQKNIGYLGIDIHELRGWWLVLINIIQLKPYWVIKC